jgi:hypothetical protein
VFALSRWLVFTLNDFCNIVLAEDTPAQIVQAKITMAERHNIAEQVFHKFQPSLGRRSYQRSTVLG